MTTPHNNTTVGHDTTQVVQYSTIPQNTVPLWPLYAYHKQQTIPKSGTQREKKYKLQTGSLHASEWPLPSKLLTERSRYTYRISN